MYIYMYIYIYMLNRYLVNDSNAFIWCSIILLLLCPELSTRFVKSIVK